MLDGIKICPAERLPEGLIDSSMHERYTNLLKKYREMKHISFINMLHKIACKYI